MKTVILVMMLVFMSVCAASPESQDTNKPFRVIGTGTTYDQAKKNGFDTAIQIVVGSVMLSEVEVKDEKLIRQDILKYSSGYVDDFKVISETTENGKTTLVMDVYVKQNYIANLLMGKPSDSVKIDGASFANRYESYVNAKTDGIELIKTVLNDYPGRAFNSKVNTTQVKLDTNRSAAILVDWRIEWNYNYIVALAQVLAKTSDRGDPHIDQGIILLNLQEPGHFFTTKYPYYYNDDNTYNLVKDRITNMVAIQISAYKNNNELLVSECVGADWDVQTYAYGAKYTELKYWGVHKYQEGTTKLVIPTYFVQSELKQLDHVEVKVVLSQECQQKELPWGYQQ